MLEDDSTYFARRAEDERRAAERAADEIARSRHLELGNLLSLLSALRGSHRSAAVPDDRTSAT